MDTSFAHVTELAKTKYHRKSDRYINYGTAGFRTKAADLTHIMFRMGLLAVLRSKYKKATIGVMITASHNPVEDNGIKLVDPMGEMLAANWEHYASELANVTDSEVKTVLNKIIQEATIDMSEKSNIFLARDNRPSSVTLASAFLEGVSCFKSHFHDFGEMTTPMLHYVVRCENTQKRYGKPTEDGYYEKLGEAFLKLRGSKPSCPGLYKPRLILDAANGVGAEKVCLLKHHLNDALDIEVLNDGSDGILNHECGADFVKTRQKLPTGLPLKVGDRYVSFDGDADRIVYFYIDKNSKFHLLDGDKIACLVAKYLKDLLNTCELDLKLGNVLTAYSNGSAKEYISKTLGVDVACTPTGVKHLHHKATEYDIGIYFEANGHGTVIFSGHAEDVILNTAGNTELPIEKRVAAQKLCTLVDLINQAVGDSISDMLLIETILHSLGWDVEKWSNIYQDRPYSLCQVKVKDKSIFKTTFDEQRLIEPKELQDAIDELVAKYTEGRSFVRASGTEDIVRVYTEAKSLDEVKQLSFAVCEKVYDIGHGVGDRPVRSA
ncbi:PGM3 [Acanthosepion pharaonis]|uniref:Phosphoacetylglucosamine mutase n=1 Tax=Acanthosepion pharaonis TaxID=158019 RepID=A0A812CVV4_ACAPH|nr:PGM3 [Sepia pharaonis]